MPRERGFTVAELLLSVTLLALLLGMGVPSFASLIRASRLAAASGGLLAAIHRTRSEAIERGVRATLCKSGDGTSCTVDGDWGQGWISFIDDDANGLRGSDEALLLTGAPASSVAITGNTPVARYVSYIPQGWTRTVNGALQMGTITVCVGGSARRIVIGSTGRPRVETGSC